MHLVCPFFRLDPLFTALDTGFFDALGLRFTLGCRSEEFCPQLQWLPQTRDVQNLHLNRKALSKTNFYS